MGSNPILGTEKEVSMLRKIADVLVPCRHPEHNPPNMILLPPGVYSYTCPGCGKTVTFTSNRVTY